MDQEKAYVPPVPPTFPSEEEGGGAHKAVSTTVPFVSTLWVFLNDRLYEEHLIPLMTQSPILFNIFKHMAKEDNESFYSLELASQTYYTVMANIRDKDIALYNRLVELCRMQDLDWENRLSDITKPLQAL